MGSALTFPVQSIVFSAIAIGSCLHDMRRRPSIAAIRTLIGQVSVFGDDIIVLTRSLDSTRKALEALGLKVNADKTFGSGNFRESCGVDAFRGHDVTTVNILDLPRKSAPESVVSSVDSHNNLGFRGYMQTASHIKLTAARLKGYLFRNVPPGSGDLGWYDFWNEGNNHLKRRFNPHLHRSEVRVTVPRGSVKRIHPKSNAGLLQFFTEAACVVTSAVSTIGYASQRPKMKLSLGWEAMP